MNSNDFINAYELMNAISRIRYFSTRCSDGSTENYWIDRNAVLGFIFSAPPECIVSVNCGKWEHKGGNEWSCSVCGNVIHTESSREKPTYKYCSEYGARMEIDNDD